MATFTIDRWCLRERYDDVTFAYGRWDRTFGLHAIVEGRRYPLGPTWWWFDLDGDVVMEPPARRLGADAFGPGVDARKAVAGLMRRTRRCGLQPLLHVEERIMFADDGGRGRGARAAPAWLRQALAAVFEYAELIPQRERKIAAAFGRQQLLALRTMHATAGIADFLAKELAAGGSGYPSLCWELAGADALSPTKRAALAEAMMSEKRSVLLGRLAPGCDGATLARLVSKLDPDSEFVPFTAKCLRQACSRPEILALLKRLPRLTPYHAANALTLPGALQTARLVGRLAIEVPASDMENVQALVDQLPAERLTALRQALGRARDVDHFMTIAYRWRERGAANSLPTPLQGTDRLVPIETVQQLTGEGLEMANCLAGADTAYTDGRRAWYRWLGEERATVELERVGDHWLPRQIKGVENEEVAVGTMAAVLAELATAVGRGYASGSVGALREA